MIHPLLERQLRRLGLSVHELPSSFEAWSTFVGRMNDALVQADQDRYTLERSLRVSSEEMQEMYEAAKLSSETALAAERDKLAKTVASLEATLAVAEDGILFVDDKRRLGMHNARFREMWRLPEEALVDGREAPAFGRARLAVREPEAWAARVQSYYDDPRSAGHDEFELLDGRIFRRYTAPVQTADGAIIGRVWFFRDVTDARQVVEQLRRANHFLDSIVENIPDMVFVKSADDLRFVRLNRAGEELLGYPRAELIGKSDRDFFPPEEAAVFQQMDRDVLARGALVTIPEEPITTRLNGTRILATKKIPVHDDAGNALYLLGIARDITDVRAVQDELRRAKEAAEAAARAKADFLANMSHELRTPLNAILGFSRILSRSPSLTEAERSHTGFIVSAAEHMLALVNDLLDLRRLEQQAIPSSHVEFEPLIRRALAFVRPTVDEKRLVIEVDVQPGHVLGEPTALTQVFLNLLSNAAKFTEDTGRITVRAQTNGARVRFSVENSGAGIAPEDQSKLFTYFEQLGQKHAHGMKGSGIGLALTRKLVERLGGVIAVASTPGQGTTFWFELPCANGEKGEAS